MPFGDFEDGQRGTPPSHNGHTNWDDRAAGEVWRFGFQLSKNGDPSKSIYSPADAEGTSSFESRGIGSFSFGAYGNKEAALAVVSFFMACCLLGPAIHAVRDRVDMWFDKSVEAITKPFKNEPPQKAPAPVKTPSQGVGLRSSSFNDASRGMVAARPQVSIPERPVAMAGVGEQSVLKV